MKKKKDSRKPKKIESVLSAEEQGELQMTLDRLSVQNPEGESFDNYLESLRGALVNREHFILALLEHLSRKPTAVGFRVFQKLSALMKEGPNRRAVKQAGYRFEQKGYLPDRENRPAGKVVLVPREERRPLCHLIPLVGTYGFVAAIIPAEGYPYPMAVTAFAEDNFKTVYVRVTESSYNVYREYIQAVSKDIPGGKVCEVPVEHAARVFFELLEFSGKSETWADLEKARQLLNPYHDPQKPPYVHQLMQTIRNPAERMEAVHTAQLLEQMDVSWLLFERESLAPYHDALENMRSSVLVLPPDMLEARTHQLLKEAADSLCTGQKRRFYIRFFEEQALIHKLSGMEGKAEDAWAVARHLSSDASPGDNLVVLGMVSLSFRQHWPESVEEDEEDDSGPFQQTDSGLFLPR